MKRGLRRALSGQALVALCSLAWLAASLEWFRGVRRVPLLGEVRENRDPLDHYPSVSVVVAARNEGEAVEGALGSILAQDYPGSLGVLVVDDRSTDSTGDVLARLASVWPDRMKVLRVERGCPTLGWVRTTRCISAPRRPKVSGSCLRTRTSASLPGASRMLSVTPRARGSTTSP